MFFVFDLETVPDMELLRATFPDGLPETDPSNVAEEAEAASGPWQAEDAFLKHAADVLAPKRSGFLPPMYHRIVSWVGLWIDAHGNPKNQASWSGEDEVDGLRRLHDELRTYKDFGLVHHNGRGFDLPVITYRSMKHGLQMPKRLNHREIRYRYSDSNRDLIDEFSNYGASSYPKLKQLGLLIGIPFKQTSDGGQVLDLFREGRLAEIEHYCKEDVIATYLIWIHLRHTTGDMAQSAFENLRSRALSKLMDIQNASPVPDSGGTGE